MGKINLLKNGYTGKVGQTVGQRWNGQLNLRTHNEHNNSKSEAQLTQREAFGQIIASAKLSQGLSSNVVPPKGYKGSKWNFFTQTVSKVMQAGQGLVSGIESGDYNKRGLTLTMCPFYKNEFYLYVYSQATNGSLNPDDYSLAIVPVLDPTTNIPDGALPIERGDIINKSIIAPVMSGIPPRGFLLHLKNAAPFKYPALVAVQGKGMKHGYKSIFNVCIPALNLNDSMLEDN